MTTKYFGGATVHSNKLQQLPARSFMELVQTQILTPVQFKMTRAELLAHPDRNALKDGRFITAATYPTMSATRGNKGADGYSIVIIDLDGSEAAPLFHDPEKINKALAPHNYVAWTTAKHSTEAPRIKIMVDCIPAAAEHYRDAAIKVSHLLNLGNAFSGRPESLTLSQPQYCPMQFLGEQFTAVFSARLDGVPFNSATATPYSDPHKYDPDLDFDLDTPQAGEVTEIGDILDLPDPRVTIASIRPALFAISPDIEYTQWCSVAAALKHQFRGPQTAEAYQLFLEWSSTGAKFKNALDCESKWASFRAIGQSGKSTTIGTIFFLAKSAGWSRPALDTQGEPINETNIDATADFTTWCQDRETTRIIVEGPSRIASYPGVTKLQVDQMVNTIVAAAKTAGAPVSKPAVAREVRSVRLQGRDSDPEMPEWLAPYCYVASRQKFRDTVSGLEIPTDAFNCLFGRHLAESDNSQSPHIYALNTIKIPAVVDSLYRPAPLEELELYIEHEGRMYVNEYRAESLPDPVAEQAALAGTLLQALLTANFPDRDTSRRVTDWFAHNVQNPGKKIRWAIYMQGGQGCGKGALMEILQSATGRTNFNTVTGNKMLKGNFDEWRAGSVVNYIDELYQSGNNRHEVNDMLKDAIANTYISVSQKFRDLKQIINTTNYFVSTNRHDALVLEESDRRYMVLKSALQSSEQVRQLSKTGLFDAIHELLHEHPGAFRAYFLAHKISPDFKPNGHAPKTKYRQELIEAGKNKLQVKIEELVADENHPQIGSSLVNEEQLKQNCLGLTDKNHPIAHYLQTMGYELCDGGKLHEVHGLKTRIFFNASHFWEGDEDFGVILNSLPPLSLPPV